MFCGFYSNYFLVDKALVHMYLLLLGLENYMGVSFVNQHFLVKIFFPVAWIVRKMDNGIHRINHYPVDSVVCFVNTYPLDSNLSGG